MLWSIITVLLIAGDHKSQKKAAFQYFKSDDFGILSFLLLCDNFQFGKDDILIVKIRYVQYILQIELFWLIPTKQGSGAVVDELPVQALSLFGLNFCKPVYTTVRPYSTFCFWKEVADFC